MGGTGSDIFYHVAGRTSTIAVGGTYTGTPSGFAPCPVGTWPANCGAVQKYNLAGAVQWTRTITVGTYQQTAQVKDVAILSGGDVVVVGFFVGTADFGGTSKTSAGAQDGFVARYSGATGALVWVKTFGGTNIDQADAVAVDPSDRIDVAGEFRGTATFGTIMRSSVTDSTDVVLLQFAADGTQNYAAFATTDSGTTRPYSIATDTMGNIAMGGSFSNSLAFGGVTVTSPNAMTGGWIGKFTSAGVALWLTEQDNDNGSEVTNGVAFDAGGDVYGTGTITVAANATDFGGPSATLAANGAADVFVVRYGAAAGAFAWVKRWGGTGNDYGNGVAVEQGGSVVVGVTTGSTPLTIDGNTPAAKGGNDVVLVRASAATGSATSVRRIGGASSDQVNGVSALGTDTLAAGFFYDTFTVDSTTLTSAGGADAYVCRTGS